MITKISISPAMREFNEAVESCDNVTYFKHDGESVVRLLEFVKRDGHLPHHYQWLANAMAGLAIKQ